LLHLVGDLFESNLNQIQNFIDRRKRKSEYNFWKFAVYWA